MPALKRITGLRLLRAAIRAAAVQAAAQAAAAAAEVLHSDDGNFQL